MDLRQGRYVTNAIVTGDDVLTVDSPFEISVAPSALYDLGRRDSI